ncbi:sodium/potassium/calcium exchanger 3-like [Lingula anatina]|uniref:Sodium/potassium/calcium exchanger 3-like n=1 Tax=Lingula anatina TaxID=7574 RepID=A0A2R2MIW8_LINAN|nr:sodium/potassium/calcium exchanger 3-like [Lingula anatina]|eukprot:XP_023930153.1 sodium/potassium/calcium exchanger 3-like [Lingula anatina]
MGSQWKSRHLLSVSSDNSSANSTFKEHERHCELELQGLPGLWVAFYFFLIIVSFTALAIVCDDFFVPSLEIISEKLDLSEDVAGATFMAAGSSAPELFTSIVGLATDNNDVGVGTIAGSAMFNILIIIALSAALAGQVLYLDWRPLIRDSIFYATSVGVFIVFAWDGKLEHYETAILLFLYILYIVLMKFNIQVMEWMAGWNFCPCLCRPVIVPTVEDTAAGTQDSEDDIHNHKSATLQSGDLRKLSMAGGHARRLSIISGRSNPDTHHDKHFHHVHHGSLSGNFATKRLSVVYSSSSHSTTVRPSVHHTEPPIPEADSEENGMKPGSPNEGSIVEIEPEMYIFPCLPPLKMAPPDSSEAKEKGGCWLWSKFILKWVLFVISFPFVVLFTWSIPDCSKDHLKKWFWFSFLMSVVWIGLLSYAMIVVVERMGCILEIDTFVMGLVFIAIGTSVPDAMSSILVARDGYGDMAVSNAIGSNVFDINLGIGLPFLIKVIIQSGAPVYLVKPGETFLYIVPHVKFGFLLLLVLLITLGVFMGSKFVLNKFIGFSFVGVYVLFLTYAFIQELICRKQLNTFC